MLRKLLMAATITMTLHLFLGVNTSSQSNVQPRSNQNTAQTPAITALK